LRNHPPACTADANALFPIAMVTASTEAQRMNAYTYLAIVTEHHSQRSVLLLQGELDVSNRDRLRCAISKALERHSPILVVDLSGLSFTDCAGLSALVWAHQRLAGHGHQLVITGAKPIVRRLLHLTGLDTYLHLSTPKTPNDNPTDSGHV
jgi:anti-sigma B factor antagonist